MVGGVATYQANQINWLHSRCDVALADECPSPTLSGLEPDAAGRLRFLKVPLWTGFREARPVLSEWLRDFRPTTVAVSNPGVQVRCFGLLRRLRRQTGARIVMTHHGGLPVMTARRRLIEILAAVGDLDVEDVVYVSQFTRRHWERRYPWTRRCRGRVVPNGVPIPSEAPVPRDLPDRPRIAFVGRLDPEKGADVFCGVAALARRQGRPLEFHAYGDGPLAPALRARAGADVRWHGAVPSVGRIFSSVDLLLMTSRVENCPYALIEAKSYGIPTVAAAAGGIPEILEDGQDGILAARRTPEALLDALDRAVEQYRSLSRGCLRTRHRYCLQATAREMWGRHLDPQRSLFS
jgi:glycosyltransferase involved in cell wall biosynthesis